MISSRPSHILQRINGTFLRPVINKLDGTSMYINLYIEKERIKF